MTQIRICDTGDVDRRLCNAKLGRIGEIAADNTLLDERRTERLCSEKQKNQRKNGRIYEVCTQLGAKSPCSSVSRGIENAPVG